MRRPWLACAFGVGLAILAVAAPAAADAQAALARGDLFWEERTKGHDDEGRARPEPIARSIEAYGEASEAAPDDLNAHWKLLRSYYFAIQFASGDPDSDDAGGSDAESRELVERGTRASDRAFEALARRAGERDAPAPNDVAQFFDADDHVAVARIHFWSGIIWGAWAQKNGLIGAVRKGVAGRLRDSALTAIALDPTYQDGGGHRLLARLHGTLPKVPFLTGWVDRSRALPELGQALAISSSYVGNKLLLAMTLLDLEPERREEAMALLEQVAASRPRPEQLVEDLAIRHNGRELLASERAQLAAFSAQ